MKYIDEFRDREKAAVLTKEIAALVSTIPLANVRPLHIMEVCGGHTHSIFRYGVEGMLPKEIELVHGPGCPVCVLPMGRVDDCVAIAERPEVIFTTFGDAMRVPGSRRRACCRPRPTAPTSAWSIRRWMRLPSPARTPSARSCSSASASRRRCRRPRSPSCRRRPRASPISRCSATTSPSCRPSRPSSTARTCSSTASSGQAMCRW